MDLALELLEWAKDKKDLGEVYYENRAGASPVVIRLVFDSAPPAVSGSKKLAYIHAPTIGTVSLSQEKLTPGAAVAAGDVLGQVEGEKEKAQIKAPLSGKVVEVMSKNGSGVGFGEPLVLLEI